jgi:hypothetical protein
MRSNSRARVEARIGRLVERRDHRRRHLVAQHGLEAERAQPVDQRAPVAANARMPRLPALLGMLAQRCGQRGDRLGWRREAPGAVLLVASPLAMKIQAEGVAAAFRGLERSAPHQHQRHARHALEPLVGREHDRLGAERPGIDRQAAKRGDRIDDLATSASGSIGLSSPVPVSTWQTATWLTLASASAASSCSGRTGSVIGSSSAVHGTPIAPAISKRRAP